MLALVDLAGGGVDGDQQPVGEFARAGRADDAGHTEFAADDRGVAGAPAFLGDDRRGALHRGHEIGRGHLRDQHIALGDQVGLGGIGDDAHAPGGDAGAGGGAAEQRLGLRHRRVIEIAGRLRQRGDRAGLKQIEAPLGPAPLDVLRAAVVALDSLADAGQLEHLRVAQLLPPAVRLAQLPPDVCLAAARSAACSVGVAHQHPILDECLPLQNRFFGLPYLIVIGADQARDDGLAQSEGGLDHDPLGVVGDRVDREHHAGRLRLHHPLHGHGEVDLRVAPAGVLAVEDRAGLEERGPAALHGVDDFRRALDVEVGGLLPGERGFGEVFGGG